MKTNIRRITLPISEELIAKIGDTDKVAFIDIETTGLSSEHNHIYMLGSAYKENGAWCISQLMAENASEEKDILVQFINNIRSYNKLIHFNGNNFDLPFIMKRCEANGIDFTLDGFDGLDIYRRVSSLKHILKLSSCKQKSIEAFLGITRDDEYTGGDLIKIYREYTQNKDEELRNFLFLHNYEDVLGMIEILPILNYCDIFSDDILVKKVQTNVYNDVNGLSKKELVMTLKLPSPIKTPVNFNANGCYFTASEKEAVLKVPLFKEEMKYFYSNYEDYYYLPEEDIAIHKSVSAYVDKDFREQAKASNCYTRKFSDYLEQWNDEFDPVFKRDYSSPLLFFELTDEIKSSRSTFNQYAAHVLGMMYNEK